MDQKPALTSVEPSVGGDSSARAQVRNAFYGSAVYSLAAAVPRLGTLIVLPINTRLLSQSDMGVLDLLDQVAAVITLLLAMDFSSALGFFYFGAPEGPERSKVVVTTLAGSLGIGLLIASAGWASSLWLSRLVFGQPIYVPYLHVLFFTLPFSLMLEASLGWLRVEDRSIAFVLGTALRTALIVAGVVVFIALLRLGVQGMQFTTLVATSLVALALAGYALARHPVLPSLAVFWRMLRFAAQLGLGGVALFIIHFGDRFLLPHYRPFSELGVYGVAYKIGMMVTLVHGAFNSYWCAQVYRIIKRDDAEVVVARLFTYFAAVLSFCALGLLVACRPALKVLTTPAYEGAALLVPIILAAYVVRGLGDFFRALLWAHGRPGYDTAFNWVGTVVCVAAYFALIPRWGARGAAIATFIAFLTIGILATIYCYRIKPYPLERSRLQKLGLVTLVTAGAYFLVPVTSLAMQIGWGILLVSSYLAGLVALRFATPGEWELLRGLPQRLAALVK
jgi:O-antigen/teichoic acid export membrane protein